MSGIPGCTKSEQKSHVNKRTKPKTGRILRCPNSLSLPEEVPFKTQGCPKKEAVRRNVGMLEERTLRRVIKYVIR